MKAFGGLQDGLVSLVGCFWSLVSNTRYHNPSYSRE